MFGAGEKRACSWGTAKEMPHRLGDFRKGVLINLVANKPEPFCPGVQRKMGDLLLIILEVEILTTPGNVASWA